MFLNRRRWRKVPIIVIDNVNEVDCFYKRSVYTIFLNIYTHRYFK